MSKFVIFFLILCIASTLALRRIRCPLEWETRSAGENFPENSVLGNALKSDNEAEYIIRSRSTVNSDDFVLGRVKKETGQGFLTTGDRIFSYDVLTNPYGCQIGWESKTHPDLAGEGFYQLKVGPTSDSQSFIGRADYLPEDSEEETKLMIGQVQNGLLTFVVDSELKNETQVVTSDEYFVLVSYNDGLELEFEDFKLNETIYATVDMLGIDELYNEADTEIGLTTVHKQTVVTSTKISSSANLELLLEISAHVKASVGIGNILSAGAGVTIPIFDLILGLSVGLEGSLEETIEETLENRREIFVGPRTSVQVCTTFNKVEDGESDFTSEAHFSAPGWTAKEIKEYLIETGTAKAEDITENAYTSHVPFGGHLGVSFGANTQFFVAPILNVNEDGPCQLLSQRIKETRGGVNPTEFMRKLLSQ